MNVVRVLAETEDTVTLSRADFDALVRAREDSIDNAAFDAAEEREARLGKEAARADHLTMAQVKRMEAGEHPLKVWREHRGMSLRDLAAAAGVAFNYISEIEGGRKPGSAEALRRLAAALGVAMEDLMPVAVNDADDGTPGLDERAAPAD